MSDPTSALGGAQFQGIVSIDELPPQGMITFRGDFASSKVQNAVREVFGVDVPAVRRANCAQDAGALWMSPDELLLLCAYGAVQANIAALSSALKDEHVLMADVSDARAVFRLKGPSVREVLAKITPADMRESALPIGELRRTRLAQVAGAFWMRDSETLDLICFRSVAEYVFTLLSTAAKSGTSVEYM